MSKAKPVVPGKTYLITRRCSQRQFLLKPSERTNKIISFLLAMACAMCGMQLHAACVMSNHLHLVLTDVRGELPEFMRYLVEFVAKCINQALGRRENVFKPGSYSRVELVDPDDVLRAIVYTLANPVEAALVRHGKQWPGVRLGPWQMGKTMTAGRPDVFYRPQGKVPLSKGLLLSKPPAFADLSDEAYVKMVHDAVEDREQGFRQQYDAEGREFLGVEGVLAQSVYATPWSDEGPRGINPTVKAADKWHRIEVLKRDKEWYATYCERRVSFRAGDSSVVFPFGTYWLHRYAGARVASPD
jgi:REP element-mobilizing transposase RayT